MPSDYSKEHIKQMMDPRHDQSVWKQDKFWEHYCDRQHDVVGFPKGVECDWCGKREEDIMNESTISIDSFNNKGQKGDDDFETWMRDEAPFVPDATTGTLGEGSSAYGEGYTVDLSSYSTTVDTSIITGSNSGITYTNPTFTIKGINFAKSIQKRLPIDLLHKWYPEQMKEDYEADD
tara:strand:- start:161 stop:691 length:531 start_codon:yes stop_codon:yes gene_type:complete